MRLPTSHTLELLICCPQRPPSAFEEIMRNMLKLIS